MSSILNWERVSDGRYVAIINGRRLTLVRNRKQHSGRLYPAFVTIGSKPRWRSTTTWYNVYETVDGETVDHTSASGNPPGSLAEAKALASRVAAAALARLGDST
jgi:hypothetical protein